MNRDLVAVASLGGTITMTADAGDAGRIRPSLTASDLIAAVPGLSQVADVSARTLATIPGASLCASDLFGALAWARQEVDGGATGAVLVQGTDTIEESAYLLDLYWDREAPLVVTGAMRSAAAAGPDGPANLLAAVLVASSPRARERGVLVVMNDQIHAASRVRKGRSSGADAFHSPSFGPLGYVVESEVVFGGTVAHAPALLLPARSQATPVAIIETHLDDDGALLELAAGSAYKGFVLDAFGVGHVSEKVAEVVSRVTSIGKPVILASRTGAGPTFSSTYGFVGSESDLAHRGVIPAGWLDARKARLLLAALLSICSTMDDIDNEFRQRGQLSAAPSAGWAQN